MGGSRPCPSPIWWLRGGHLERLLAERAPRTAAALNPPVAGAAAQAEEALGVAFTDELREWFGLHDGASQDWPGDRPEADIFPLQVPFSAAEAAESALTWRRVWANQGLATPEVTGQAGEITASWIDQYVPIAKDIGGDLLIVDLRPGPRRGCVSAFTGEETDQVDDPLGWPSLTAALTALVKSLQTGNPLNGTWTPRFVDGEIDWQ